MALLEALVGGHLGSDKKNQVYANILGTRPISCLRRKIFMNIHFSAFDVL